MISRLLFTGASTKKRCSSDIKTKSFFCSYFCKNTIVTACVFHVFSPLLVFRAVHEEKTEAKKSKKGADFLRTPIRCMMKPLVFFVFGSKVQVSSAFCCFFSFSLFNFANRLYGNIRKSHSSSSLCCSCCCSAFLLSIVHFL